jgi:hypothetical protein
MKRADFPTQQRGTRPFSVKTVSPSFGPSVCAKERLLSTQFVEGRTCGGRGNAQVSLCATEGKIGECRRCSKYPANFMLVSRAGTLHNCDASDGYGVEPSRISPFEVHDHPPVTCMRGADLRLRNRVSEESSSNHCTCATHR